MTDFDKSFRSTEKFVKSFIAIVALFMFLIFVAYGYIGYKVVSNPQEISKTIGESIGAGVKSFKDATK